MNSIGTDKIAKLRLSHWLIWMYNDSRQITIIALPLSFREAISMHRKVERTYPILRPALTMAYLIYNMKCMKGEPEADGW